MNILITGGAGFIGSHLVDKLLMKNNKVLVIDNFVTGRRENLLEHPNLTLIEGTIGNNSLVEETFNKFKPEIVVHTAASYKDPDNWVEDVITNVLGTVNILQASKTAKVKKIIYFQTSLCYGIKPIEQPISLNHPLFSGKYSGGSSYAISKTAAELYIEFSDLEFISFRLANAYGPRNLSGPLPTFYNRLSDNKKCFVVDTRRDFIYIDDLIEIVLASIDDFNFKGFYHISTGSDYSIKELFDAVVDAMGIILKEEVEIKPRNPDDTYTILIDPTKTKQDFNWKPSTPLKEGVRKAVEWYNNNPIFNTFTHLKTDE